MADRARKNCQMFGLFGISFKMFYGYSTLRDFQYMKAAPPAVSNVPPTARTGPIIPPVAAVSALDSAKNLAPQVDMHVPRTVLQAKAAAGAPTPPVTAPNVKPAAL